MHGSNQGKVMYMFDLYRAMKDGTYDMMQYEESLDAEDYYDEPPDDVYYNESDYSTESFFTKIVGVNQNNRQEFVRLLSEGDKLIAVREPDNKFDKNAIAIFDGIKRIGYFSKEIAQNLAPKMDAGFIVSVCVKAITGLNQPIRGVNIKVTIYPGNGQYSITDPFRDIRERYADDAMQSMLVKKIREEREIQENKDVFSNWLKQNFIV